MESSKKQSARPQKRQQTQKKTISRQEKFVSVLKQILPQLGKDTDKIIHAQVMLTLKLEGIIGKKLEEDDMTLIQIIKDSILESTEKTEDALLVANRILTDETAE